jgi:ComF family protein
MIRREIIRQHNTRSQIGMSADDRKQNLRHAFHITKTFPYQKIAIIDDVITTGTTIRELCRLLKKNGIAEIDVWCIARTGL